LTSRNEIIGYAMSFISALISCRQLSKQLLIRRAILFGSIARDDFNKDSDVDIFIDVYSSDLEEKVKDIVNERLKHFEQSKLNKTWKLKGIENQISCSVGMLQEWDLRTSVASDGVVLYGAFKDLSTDERPRYVLFMLESISDVTKRNRVVRKFIGRREKNFISKGLVKELHGTVLSSRAFMVPPEASERIARILGKENVEYRLFEGWLSE